MKFKKTAALPILMSLLLVIVLCSCGQQSNTAATEVDSLSLQHDSATANGPIAVAQESRDPNVYEIPRDYPWLLQLISERMPWDSATDECSRITTYKEVFSQAKSTTQEIKGELVATYKFKDSFIKIAQMSFDEASVCQDNICQVVLRENWVPIGVGLRVGMSKSEFLKKLNLDTNSKQNIYNYIYTLDGTASTISVVFKFENDVMNSFYYALSPCSSYTLPVPKQPFLVKLFNKPFQSMKPDSVLPLIKTKVTIAAERDEGHIYIDKIAESDTRPVFEFDSSIVRFKKWPAWEITYADLKSPHLSFINGIKVGMARDAFLTKMGEEDFKGDEFYRANDNCMDGYKSTNDFTVFFKDGVIREIVYSRSQCR